MGRLSEIIERIASGETTERDAEFIEKYAQTRNDIIADFQPILRAAIANNKKIIEKIDENQENLIELVNQCLTGSHYSYQILQDWLNEPD